MSDVSVKVWANLEKGAFDEFDEYYATLIEDGIFRALAERMKNMLNTMDVAEVTLPWGTYRAEVKDRGDSSVITPTWEPSKGFLKMLNDDSEGTAKYDKNYQDYFDPEYVQLFRNYVADGVFYPDQEPNNKKRGIKLKDDEIPYFLNGFSTVLYNIAKDKQRDGKTYRLEIDAGFPHGSFDFEYEGDDIKVKFVPHKVFKQYLKDDSVTDAARVANFNIINETTVTRVPNGDADGKKSKKAS